jgi:hypothetical protein
MRPKSTTLDLPSSYDVKVYLHNEFVKHIGDLKEQITVSSHFIRVELNLQHTLEGGTRKDLNHLRCVVSGYNEDGVFGDDGPLDRGKE